MKPASLCLDRERIGIIQQATGCEAGQAAEALFNLEDHDWKNFKRHPGEPGNTSMLPPPSERMLAAQQQLKSVLINEGVSADLALYCTREFFLELSQQYGGKSLHVPLPKWMKQVLASLS